MFIGQENTEQSDDECHTEIEMFCKNFINEPTAKTEQELAQVLEKHNLQLYCYSSDVTSQDKKDVARMAFNVYVDRPQEYQLSPIVRSMKNNPQNRISIRSDDYDLSNSST